MKRTLKSGKAYLLQYSLIVNDSRALLLLATEELSKLGKVWPLIPLLVTALPITRQHTRLIVL